MWVGGSIERRGRGAYSIVFGAVGENVAAQGVVAGCCCAEERV